MTDDIFNNPVNRVLVVILGVLSLVTLVVGFIAVQIDAQQDSAVARLNVVTPGES